MSDPRITVSPAAFWQRDDVVAFTVTVDSIDYGDVLAALAARLSHRLVEVGEYAHEDWVALAFEARRLYLMVEALVMNNRAITVPRSDVDVICRALDRFDRMHVVTSVDLLDPMVTRYAALNHDLRVRAASPAPRHTVPAPSSVS